MDIRVAARRKLKLLECVSEKHKFYIKDKVGTSSGSIFLTNSIFQHLNVPKPLLKQLERIEFHILDWFS